MRSSNTELGFWCATLAPNYLHNLWLPLEATTTLQKQVGYLFFASGKFIYLAINSIIKTGCRFSRGALGREIILLYNLLYHPVFGKTLQIWAFLIASSFLRMLAGGAQARKGLQ